MMKGDKRNIYFQTYSYWSFVKNWGSISHHLCENILMVIKIILAKCNSPSFYTNWVCLCLQVRVCSGSGFRFLKEVGCNISVVSLEGGGLLRDGWREGWGVILDLQLPKSYWSNKSIPSSSLQEKYSSHCYTDMQIEFTLWNNHIKGNYTILNLVYTINSMCLPFVLDTPASFPIQRQDHIMESNQCWTMRYCNTWSSHGPNLSTKSLFHISGNSTRAFIKNGKFRLMVK